jgi:hypothetical protein
MATTGRLSLAAQVTQGADAMCMGVWSPRLGRCGGAAIDDVVVPKLASHLNFKLEGDMAGSLSKVEEGGTHPSGDSTRRWQKTVAWP